MVAPKGLPAEISKRLSTALVEIAQSKDYADFMGARGFGIKVAAGPEFLSFWKENDADLGTVMKKVGLAK